MDVIIEVGDLGIVLIREKNPPVGWSVGDQDYGESLEEAAVREALEETALPITLTGQLHTYSNPDRGPWRHTITTVFTARADGTPRAGDDAAMAGIFREGALPSRSCSTTPISLPTIFAGAERRPERQKGRHP